jgi:histidine ammonia-lyase
MAAATPEPFALGETPLTLERIAEVARRARGVALAEAARERIRRARAVVDAIERGGDGAPAVYGVNTGFGFLADVRISAAQIRDLQRNLVRSHAAGVGPLLPTEVVRGMLLLRAAVLCAGHSGVRLEVADLLVAMLNRGVHPRIPSQGSVGASGDLAPLAHLALVVMGEGEAEHDGRILDGTAALAAAGLRPIELGAKEGLSLVNGTQLMTSLGALAVLDADRLARTADLAGAMSLEAWKGTPRAFDPRIQAARPHPGQAASARNLERLLAGSGIVESHKDCGKVQDPYSLRCMPQVHGATRDALAYARRTLEVEAGAATDNPLVFAAEGELISGGNFHGQPVALALDFAGIAAAELANIAERRIEQLVNPHLSSGLPPFLAPESGLNSGFMIAQVSAAALVSENKVLAHPASVDSIPTSAGQEDHVSMGNASGLKALQVLANSERALAIELLAGAQGVEFLAPLEPGPGVAAARSFVRTLSPRLVEDRSLSVEIEHVATAIRDGSLLAAVETEVGALR